VAHNTNTQKLKKFLFVADITDIHLQNQHNSTTIHALYFHFQDTPLPKKILHGII